MRVAGPNRRSVLKGAAVLLGAAAAPGAYAQNQNAVRLIYPFAAGSGGDTMARIVAEKLSAGLSVPVIVENRTGAAGRIGVKAVVGAEPDGTTLLFIPNPPVAIYPHSYPDLEYDPVRDLTPVSLIATFDVALAVSSKNDINSVKELIAWAKANPSQANYGSPGAGGLGHFFAVMVATDTGLDLKHVSYRGSGAVMSDLLGGQIPIAVVPLGDALELHRGGKARVLATSGVERSPLLPDVPTMKEAGINAEGQGWYAVYAPAKTPADTVARLNRIIVDGLADADTKAKVLRLNMVPRTSSPQQLAAFRDADSARWAPAVKASGFKPQQ
ncbi:MAG: Bug family tripartite tricarboxylate transporter substrate binding protein [Pseudorhodoplanes sp.]|uniref:Bug family tripartite tricarboxylate transporter substrate binding protein n=1 Tax=Pseudorhodoplanes sp. TaxID=1934341 RepID=UPI003D0BB6D9